MMERPALFLDSDAGVVQCRLCPRRCAIQSGFSGACGVRCNKNGTGILPFYGHITALALDPIEKKPLYHFRPGSQILSAGFAGCNLHCPFCQNWRISQSADSGGRQMKPAEIISAALHADGPPGEPRAIAYTYSEPLVHIEYLLDCMELARKHGIANVLVSNGCVNSEAAGEVLSLADAANIDLKCFSGETYAGTLSGSHEEGIFDAVLGFIRLACEKGVHVEITTLVVPGLNDSAGELDSCAGFIASLGGEVPWHLSAYHPDYRWNAPTTDPSMLLDAAKRARKKIPYVYTGNISGEENNTACLHCGAILIRRRGCKADVSNLAPPAGGERFPRCTKCGQEASVIY